MNTPHTKVRYLDSEEIGRGAENMYFMRTNDDDTLYQNPDCRTENSLSVVGIPTWFSRRWRTLSAEFLRKCLFAHQRHRFKLITARILQDCLVIQNDQESIVEVALEIPFDPEIDHKTVKVREIFDPETGPHLIREIIKMIYGADQIYHKDQLGLDPIGGKAAGELVYAMYQHLVLALSKAAPTKELRELLESKAPGIEGQMHNVNLEEGELMFTDIGMHDFSKKGRYKLVTKLLHHLMFGSLIEILKMANREMPEEQRINEDFFDHLPFNGNIIHRMLAKAATLTLMPMYERFEQKNRPQSPPLISSGQNKKLDKPSLIT